MSRRYRLMPTPEQEQALLEHCAHARYVWNLAVEQNSWWRPGRGHAPDWLEQSRQATEARAEFEWLREGSQIVQAQALRDFNRAMRSFFAGTHAVPSWRKAGHNESFRFTGERGKHWNVRRLSRHVGAVRIPKLGYVRFRWSRPVPPEAKSYRVTRDRAGRWHVAFPLRPEPVPGPGTGEVVGIDRGVTVSAALSTGELLHIPRPSRRRRQRELILQRKLRRAKRGSNRRGKVALALARFRAAERDARRDWCEKVSTDVAQRFDVIRIEDLRIKDITRTAKGTIESPGSHVRQKAGLNRGIRASGWGLLATRLEDKAPGRVQKVKPHYTSQRCSACGHVDPESRKSQARFRCTACGFALNADVNAARNIAAGHAVNARGGLALAGLANREPTAA